MTHDDAFPYQGCWVTLRRHAVWNPDTEAEVELGGPVYVEAVDLRWISFQDGGVRRYSEGWRDGRLRMPLGRVISLERVHR